MIRAMKLLLSIFLMILAYSNGLPGGGAGTFFGVGDGGQFSDGSNVIQDHDANNISNSSSSTDEIREPTKAGIDGSEVQNSLQTGFKLVGLTDVFPPLRKLDAFDGPANVSYASLPTPTLTKMPTLDQMMYYNYYTVSVYCSAILEDLSCLYCKHFKDDIKSFKILENRLHQTKAFVSVSEKREEIVVTYRGTSNLWNFVQDFYFVNGEINEKSLVKIHRGFYRATMSLYDDVVKTVGRFRKQKEYSKYKIVIAGHSLGAAMARVTEFFLLSLKQFPGAVYEVYGYGEPRSGNKYYVDFLNNQNVTTARIINRGDVVPHVPPTSVLGTTILLGDYYLHTATEYWIKNNVEQRFCSQSVYEDPTCSDSLGPFYRVFEHIVYFDAHYITCANLEILQVPFPIPKPRDNDENDEDTPPLPRYISSFDDDTDLINKI